MTFRIQVYRESLRWEVQYPQRHFVTPTSAGHVYVVQSGFGTFKEAVVFAQEYRKEYLEWSDIPFIYMCNNGGKMELHDLNDDVTVLEFILRLQ